MYVRAKMIKDATATKVGDNKLISMDYLKRLL